MRKYEILENDTIEVDGRTLYRIKALKQIGYVKPGQLGGYIEKESNLSHFGESWIHDNAMAYDNARICDNAKLYERAKAYDNAKIHDNICVCDNVMVCGDTELRGNGHIYSNMIIMK